MTIDSTDFANAQRLHGGIGWVSQALSFGLLGVAVLLLISGVVLLAAGQTYGLGLLPGAAFLGMLGFMQAIWLPRRWAQIFKQQKDLSAPAEIELSGEGFRMGNEFGNVHLPWSHFRVWKENADLLLLYRSDMVFNILPKRYFRSETDIEQVREWLRQNRLPVARSGWPLIRIVLALLLFVVCIFTLAYSYLSNSVP